MAIIIVTYIILLDDVKHTEGHGGRYDKPYFIAWFNHSWLTLCLLPALLMFPQLPGGEPPASEHRPFLLPYDSHVRIWPRGAQGHRVHELTSRRTFVGRGFRRITSSTSLQGSACSSKV